METRAFTISRWPFASTMMIRPRRAVESPSTARRSLQEPPPPASHERFKPGLDGPPPGSPTISSDRDLGCQLRRDRPPWYGAVVHHRTSTVEASQGPRCSASTHPSLPPQSYAGWRHQRCFSNSNPCRCGNGPTSNQQSPYWPRAHRSASCPSPAPARRCESFSRYGILRACSVTSAPYLRCNFSTPRRYAVAPFPLNTISFVSRCADPDSGPPQ